MNVCICAITAMCVCVVLIIIQLLSADNRAAVAASLRDAAAPGGTSPAAVGPFGSKSARNPSLQNQPDFERAPPPLPLKIVPSVTDTLWSTQNSLGLSACVSGGNHPPPHPPPRLCA